VAAQGRLLRDDVVRELSVGLGLTRRLRERHLHVNVTTAHDPLEGTVSLSPISARSRALPVYTTVLAWIFAAICAVMAVAVPIFDRANWELAGSILYVLAALLVITGLFAFSRASRWLAAGLVVAGALAGGVFLIWTLVVPLMGLALILLTVRAASGGSSRAASLAA
jgi:hypothetical protein